MISYILPLLVFYKSFIKKANSDHNNLYFFFSTNNLKLDIIYQPK